MLDPNLCSHVTVVCYMAQSLFDDYKLLSQECRQFCPSFGIFGTLNPPNTIAAANQNELEIGDKADLKYVLLICNTTKLCLNVFFYP